MISVHDDPDTQTRVSGLSPGSSRSVLPAEETSLWSQSGSDQLGTRESAHELGAARLLHTARKHTGDRAENRRLSVRHPARSTSSAWPPVLYPTPGKEAVGFGGSPLSPRFPHTQRKREHALGKAVQPKDTEVSRRTNALRHLPRTAH